MFQLSGAEFALRLEHRHEDGSWARLEPRPSHHDPAEHDPERDWANGRIYVCSTLQRGDPGLRPRERGRAGQALGRAASSSDEQTADHEGSQGDDDQHGDRGTVGGARRAARGWAGRGVRPRSRPASRAGPRSRPPTRMAPLMGRAATSTRRARGGRRGRGRGTRRRRCRRRLGGGSLGWRWGRRGGRRRSSRGPCSPGSRLDHDRAEHLLRVDLAVVAVRAGGGERELERAARIRHARVEQPVTGRDGVRLTREGPANDVADRHRARGGGERVVPGSHGDGGRLCRSARQAHERDHDRGEESHGQPFAAAWCRLVVHRLEIRPPMTARIARPRRNRVRPPRRIACTGRDRAHAGGTGEERRSEVCVSVWP